MPLSQLPRHQGLRDGGVVHVGLARGAVQLPRGRAGDGLGDGVGLDLDHGDMGPGSFEYNVGSDRYGGLDVVQAVPC